MTKIEPAVKADGERIRRWRDRRERHNTIDEANALAARKTAEITDVRLVHIELSI